jgi:hypothetical protein
MDTFVYDPQPYQISQINSYGLLLLLVKVKAKDNFRTVAIFLFHIVQKTALTF